MPSVHRPGFAPRPVGIPGPAGPEEQPALGAGGNAVARRPALPDGPHSPRDAGD